MSDERSKMSDFVGKLWSNPALANISVSKKEAQILSFLKDNQNQLQQAFAMPQYFPGMKWDQAISLFLTSLTERILGALDPKLDEILEHVLAPETLQALDVKPQGIQKTRVKEFILKCLRNKTTRDPYVSVLETISFGFFERYIPRIVLRHKVIFGDLYRRDRLNLPAETLAQYLSLCSLFRPLYFMKLAGVGNLTSKDPKVYDQAMAAARAYVFDEAGDVPDKIIRAGMESCIKISDKEDISGSARLIAIMVSRAVDFDPGQRQDRGAETPDKSWFHIRRKTSKFYGMDERFLDELYQIASEEGW